MGSPFERLLRRALPLGNTARKFTRAIERNGDLLVSRLEVSGGLPRVHLDRAAPSLADDFDLVAAAARDPQEQLTLLGVFYAVQYLLLNARALERLAVDLAESHDARASYRSFLARSETDFTELAGAYIRRVLRVLTPRRLKNSYLICSVGSRGHQDDIDVAVLDDGGPDRPLVDKTMGQLTVQMLRHASALDHYLAARVKTDGLTLSPEELAEALRNGRLDFVVVTELLRAEPLAGSRALLRRLRGEVVAPYLHRAGEDNSRHELYLRGLLGEVRSLLLRPPPPGVVNPKDDALRLIVALTLALKTAEGLQATRTRDLLRLLRGRRPSLRGPLSRLEESLVFLETFHHLAHLFIAEEEDISVEGEAARANLGLVAEAMGYHDQGPVRGVDHLMVHYNEAVGAAREVALPLMEEAARHLRETSRFSRWTRGAIDPAPPPIDFAEELALGATAFLGARFWDDVLEALAAPDGALLARLAASFARLPLGRRAEVAALYAEWGCEAPYALLTLVTLLARRPGAGGENDPAREITRAFLERLGREVEEIRALSRTFRFYPGLLNRFLLTLGREEQELLLSKLDVSIGSPEVAEARDRFRAFIGVHRDTSRYLKRVLARLTERFPATVLALSEDAHLRTLCRGRLAAAERHPNSETQKGLLGDFYDMEFLRIAVGTLHGTANRATRGEFAELTETYLGDLFDVCLREAERERGTRMLGRDMLGIYLAGGHARSRPYDEDYDFLVMIDSDDPEDRGLAERAVVLMNRQIARRGVVAQYRLGERLGRFCVGFGEIERMARDGAADFFVDLHQMLGAREIVGGARVEAALRRRVLEPFLFARTDSFRALLGREVRERRLRLIARPEGQIHIKNMRGGLRELDFCLAAERARLGVREQGALDPFETLARIAPEREASYRALVEADAFLVAVRSAYRVLVAATDVVEREYLAVPARTLGYEGPPAEAAAALFADIERHSRAASAAVDELLPEALA
ncbi:hypothetical protein LLG88_11120 [bacterium]|nr:hypothetical protein [bacterium]